MSLIRVFIAIEIPEKIKKEIAEQTAAMRLIVDRAVRWGTAENLHLTIRFLGEIPATQVDPLTRALETIPASGATPTGTVTSGYQWWATDWHYFVMP